MNANPVWCARLPDDWPASVPAPDYYGRACTEDHEHIPAKARGNASIVMATAEYARLLSTDEQKTVSDYLSAKYETPPEVNG